MVLIEHPEHGRTHVYTPEELKYHQERGWSAVINSAPDVQSKVTPIKSKRTRARK